jgi:hypothetical protein
LFGGKRQDNAVKGVLEQQDTREGWQYILSTNEGGTAEEYKAFVPCFYGRGGKFFCFIKLTEPAARRPGVFPRIRFRYKIFEGGEQNGSRIYGKNCCAGKKQGFRLSRL